MCLQGGLGYAHPVVGWPGDTGVEVQADDRGSWCEKIEKPTESAFKE